MSKGIIFDYDKSKKKEKKEKKKSLLDEFDDITDSYKSYSPISAYIQKKEKKTEEEEEDMGDEWLRTITNMKNDPVVKRKKVGTDAIFDYVGSGKKKKKKKKNKDALKDYNEEFEPEMNLLRNMLMDQTKFVTSLQRRYDIMDTAKSSARGVGKFTTDLISAINQGRQINMNIVDKMANLKKTAADLNMKEKKENASLNGLGDGEDINNFSSTFLKNIIRESREDASFYGDGSPIVGNEDMIMENIMDELKDSERSEESDIYLKYEKRNVELVALVNKDDESDYEIAAYADDGERIYDYPIPEIERLYVNRSTGYGTDEYQTKYKIIYK